MAPAKAAPFPTFEASTATPGKENAPLHQSTILAALDKANFKSRKRVITLVNGAELDLNGTIPVTPQILEALRLRVIQLEDEISAQQPPAKRAKTNAMTTASEPSTSAGPSTVSSTKAEEKKRKMQLKKIFDRLKKECKSDSVKFQGLSKTIKFDEVLEQTEFEALFGGKGTLIQPTPTNKPKSTVTIIDFKQPAQIRNLFGDELKALKGNRWSIGGMPARRMGGGFGGMFGGGGSTFTKSIKQGACDVAIRTLEVTYSKNGMKCTLKFEVAQVGGGGYDYDSDY